MRFTGTRLPSTLLLRRALLSPRALPHPLPHLRARVSHSLSLLFTLLPLRFLLTTRDLLLQPTPSALLVLLLRWTTLSRLPLPLLATLLPLLSTPLPLLATPLRWRGCLAPRRQPGVVTEVRPGGWSLLSLRALLPTIPHRRLPNAAALLKICLPLVRRTGRAMLTRYASLGPARGPTRRL